VTPRAPQQGTAGRRRDEVGPGRRGPSYFGAVPIREGEVGAGTFIAYHAKYVAATFNIRP